MKWVFVAIAAALLFPLAQWLRANPRGVDKAWVAIGLLPFVLPAAPMLDVALISLPDWPGLAKGIEVSALDVLALAMYLSLPGSRYRLPFRLAMAIYFIAMVLSIFQAQVPIASIFYIWQLARMFLLYAVVAKACALDSRVASFVLAGFAIGLCLQACLVTFQRFGLGVLQATGTFGHQNGLGMAIHFAVYPSFALLLAGERGWQLVATTVAGAFVAVLTVSRATVGLVGSGLTLIFGLSAIRRWTSRKAMVAVLAIFGVGLLAPIAYSALERRIAGGLIELEQEYDERAAFERVASMMLSNYPLGVGANNYVITANSRGYMDRAGVAPRAGSRSTSVHNVYWLTAAETGYIGLVALVMLLARITFVALACGWRNRNDVRGDLLLGLGVGLLTASVHSYFEWILLVSPLQYLLAIATGLVAGLSQQLGYWSTKREVVGSIDSNKSQARLSAR